MKTPTLIATTLAVLATMTHLHAADTESPRVTVYGTAKLEVVPDVLHMALPLRAPDLLNRFAHSAGPFFAVQINLNLPRRTQGGHTNMH